MERIHFAADAAQIEAYSQAERLRTALLSSISHDLRTPLTAILGAASSLKRDEARLSPLVRDSLLDAIEEEALRLDRFVNNLLDMTRLEAGVITPKREWVDCADAVEGALMRVKRSLGLRTVQRDIPDHLPPVGADPVLLETVLVNILDNAAKYGEGLVRIVAEGADTQVRIGIEDDGPGIATDALPHVFDKFYRGVKGPYAAAGTGLGLSICRGLIEAMGGTIKADSPVREGRGTRITIQLPAGSHPAEEGIVE